MMICKRSADFAAPSRKTNQAVKTTVAASISKTVSNGPHSRLSGFDGVIQFRIVTRDWTPSATHLVHPGHCGHNPAADRTPQAMAASTKIEIKAAMRPAAGKAPVCFPPCVQGPQGAPAISAS